MASDVAKKVELTIRNTKTSIEDTRWFKSHIIGNKKRNKRMITNQKKYGARQERRKVTEQLNNRELE
jgi:hypothetical protein